MSTPKKIFTDDVSVVAADWCNSIYGGLSSSDDPTQVSGHKHDGLPYQGHSSQIDLTTDVTGRFLSPTLELKSIKLSATQATPLTSSLFWTLPIPSDAYTAVSYPMYLKIYWSGNSSTSPSNTAFRIDYSYIQAGNNVMPPSILNLGAAYWPANLVSAHNAASSTFRFKVSAAPNQLYINDTTNGANSVALTLPSSVSGATLANFVLLGLEITTAPTVTLSQPMTQVNIYAIELSYYSQTLGAVNTINAISNDQGLGDF